MDFSQSSTRIVAADECLSIRDRVLEGQISDCRRWRQGLNPWHGLWRRSPVTTRNGTMSFLVSRQITCMASSAGSATANGAAPDSSIRLGYTRRHPPMTATSAMPISDQGRDHVACARAVTPIGYFLPYLFGGVALGAWTSTSPRPHHNYGGARSTRPQLPAYDIISRVRSRRHDDGIIQSPDFMATPPVSASIRCCGRPVSARRMGIRHASLPRSNTSVNTVRARHGLQVLMPPRVAAP